jgi:hypothetical protein
MSKKRVIKKKETEKEVPKKKKLIVKIKKKKEAIPELRNYNSSDPELRSFNSGDSEIIRRILNRREDINLPSPQSNKITSEEEFPPLPLTPGREHCSTTRSRSTAWNQSHQASNLEAHSSPATRGNISQIDPLSSGSTVHNRSSTSPSRFDTITDNTEINSSPHPFSTE